MKVDLSKLSKSIKVAACPLCGEEAILHRSNSIFSAERYWVKCSNLDCGCTANSSDDMHLTLRGWNRRTAVKAA